MQLKLELPGSHLNREQDHWERFDQSAQQELLLELARVLGKAIVQKNSAHQVEDRDANEATAND